MPQTKVCLHCGKRKQISKFYLRRACPQYGDKTRPQHRPECKACTAARREAVLALQSKHRNQRGSKPCEK